TRHAVEGKTISGVVVATSIIPISEESVPAFLSASKEASTAMSDVAIFSGAMLLAFIPALCSILFDVVPNLNASSSLVSLNSGT
ncbi:MAG: hypothetical protein AAGU16_15580, partial [Desulfitobacterium hafniense]